MESAFNAGMNVVVIASMHTPDEFPQEQRILTFTPDFQSNDLSFLFK